jgi:hypothetical protein
MTYEEFLIHLATTSRTWRVTSDWKLRLQDGIAWLCPLTAVCYRLTGRHFSTYSWALAANVMQVDFDGSDVVKAADGLDPYNTTIRTMRDDLLQACGCQGETHENL